MRLRTVPAAAAAVLAVALAACAAQTPEERVTALRAEYQVTLQGFQVVEQPLAAPAPVPVEEAGTASPGTDAATGQPVAGEAEGPGAADSAPAPPPEVPVRQDVILDLVVDNRSDGRLPGLTVDVEQGDAQAEAKTSYRIYLDTSGIAPGTRGAISHRLEDVEVAPGDGFRVEVRQAIPPEEREQYRELDEAGDEP